MTTSNSLRRLVLASFAILALPLAGTLAAISPSDESVITEPDPEVTEWTLPRTFDAPRPSLGPIPPETTGCVGFETPITPIQVSAPPASRFLSYQNEPVLIVGVSADNVCHLEADDVNLCRRANFRQILPDLRARGLNKLRLWVALGSEVNPNDNAARAARNQPFLRDAGGFYRFDQKNAEYFARVREVVHLAKLNDLFVEVTFFAPGDGFNPEQKSPWLRRRNQARAANPQTGAVEPVGFSDYRYFAIPAVGEPGDARMREFQKNVIDWTVDELWCYDNVWWEIGNEIDGRALRPDQVAAWQREMILYAHEADRRHEPTLRSRHLVAVEPLTHAGAMIWTSPNGLPCQATPTLDFRGCQADVVNGHYTQVLTRAERTFPSNIGFQQLDLGAIELLHEFGRRGKVFGSNETNITSLAGPKGTRALSTDTNPRRRTFGLPDPARAEAWEFVLSGGGAFDHYGYAYDSPNGRAIRDQLGRLRQFLTDVVPLVSMDTSASVSAPANWVEPGTYPNNRSWDRATDSRKYWAAIESRGWKTAATGREFLLYVHHSTPRCKALNDDFALQSDNKLKCTGEGLPFDAYDARIRNVKPYQEVNLKLHLGAQAGTFEVTWLDPANPTGPPRGTQTLVWQPSGERCNGVAPCRVTSPKYPYDLLLRVRQR